MNNFENISGSQGGKYQMTSDSGVHSSQNAANNSVGSSNGGQVAQMPSSGYQYINKQVNNVKLVNNNSLTLNVRNFNNRINNININNINEEGQIINSQPQMANKIHLSGGNQNFKKAENNQLRTQRYSRENSLSKLGNGVNMSNYNDANQANMSEYLLQQQQNLQKMKNGTAGSKSNNVSPMRIQTSGGVAPSSQTDIQSTSNSHQNLKFKNVQEGIGRQSKSPISSNNVNMIQGRNSSSISHSKLNASNSKIQANVNMMAATMGNTSQRKSLAISANHGQGSLNPQKAFHNQRTSVDNQSQPQNQNYSREGTIQNQRTSVASHRSSNSAVNNGIQGQKSASNLNQSSSSNNLQKHRSSSKQSSGAHSANNITTGSSLGSTLANGSNLNVIHSKLYEQQQIISKHIEKERRYNEKIKQLKSENKKLVQLLKDSEKLFYQKIQEAKQQSSSLSMLIKQLWPVVKTKVKDPVLLLNTINQCVQSQSKSVSNPMQPLIEDIELLSAKDLKDKGQSQDPAQMIKQHQTEILNLQQAFQEQMIKMDNDFNRVIQDKKIEMESIQIVAVQQSQMQEFVKLPSSALKALHLDIDFQDIINQKPGRVSSIKETKKSQTKSSFSIFENKRASASNMMAEQQKLLQLQNQRAGRNNRQQSDSNNGQSFAHANQNLQYSKSASNLNNMKNQQMIINQKMLDERGGTQQQIGSGGGFSATTRLTNAIQSLSTSKQMINNFIEDGGNPSTSQKRGKSSTIQGSDARSKSSQNQYLLSKQDGKKVSQVPNQSSNSKNTFSFGFNK